MPPDALDGELKPENIGTPSVLHDVVDAAHDKGWRVLGSVEQPPRAGYLQNGSCVVRRDHCPFPERPFAKLDWARQSDGEIVFSNGTYDCERTTAFDYMVEDARIERMDRG